MKKMIEYGINPAELTTFFASKNHRGLLRKVERFLGEVSDRIMSLPADSNNDIKTFIKNELSGKPIIPGSSLKGALRSVILKYLLRGERPERLNEKNYFGDANEGDELMRFIKISDAEFEDTALVNTKIFNLHKVGNNWEGGWKHAFRGRPGSPATDNHFNPIGFNTIYESLLPSQRSRCTIMLSELGFNKISTHSHLEEKEELFNIHELFNTVNQHTYDYISKEIDFFNNYSQAENSNKIISQLNRISNEIPDHDELCDSCVLKMSAGSGFHSITGDWQYEDYAINQVGEQKFKSRKIAIYRERFYPMGFVKLFIRRQGQIQ